MDLKECLRKGFIKRTKVDQGLINSLIEMSNLKEEIVNKTKLTDRNISVYVSMTYDSLREILEALSISKGYKVISHICLGYFLEKFFPSFDHSKFDRFRWIRNSINYYGNKIDLAQGKELINQIFDLKKKSLKIIEK